MRKRTVKNYSKIITYHLEKQCWELLRQQLQLQVASRENPELHFTKNSQNVSNEILSWMTM